MPRLKFEGDTRMFVTLAAALFIWFYFLVDVFIAYLGNNVMLIFSVFIVAYIYFTMRFVMGTDPLKSPRNFAAWILIFMAFDVMLFPLMVGRDVQPQLGIGDSISSDVFIYKLLPDYLPQEARYGIVYVLAPTLMLFVAYKLIGRRAFHAAVKEAF